MSIHCYFVPIMPARGVCCIKKTTFTKLAEGPGIPPTTGISCVARGLIFSQYSNKSGRVIRNWQICSACQILIGLCSWDVRILLQICATIIMLVNVIYME